MNKGLFSQRQGEVSSEGIICLIIDQFVSQSEAEGWVEVKGMDEDITTGDETMVRIRIWVSSFLMKRKSPYIKRVNCFESCLLSFPIPSVKLPCHFYVTRTFISSNLSLRDS